jgi:Putative transposase
VHQRELLLPVKYFHVVFTLPAELRRVMRAHQRTLLPVLFRAAFDALAQLCLDRRWLGGKIGALAVLHTWTRTLEWHPHVHMLVPAGGLAADGRTWRQPRKRKVQFLVPVKLLSARFRARFIKLATRALAKEGVELPWVPTKKRWVVYCKPTVQGAEQVLQYLGRYVHRTALSDKAILYSDEQIVRFGYRDSATHERKEMTLPGHEFLRRFLQHVPMKGMHRVRSFGLLHPKHRLELQRVQLMLGVPPATPEPSEACSGPQRCPACKTGQLGMARRLTPEQCAQRASMAITLAPLARAATPTARAPPHSHEERRCA